MHAVASQALRTAQKSCLRYACVSRIRRPVSRQKFHQTATLCQSPEDANPSKPATDESTSDVVSENSSEQKRESEKSEADAVESAESQVDEEGVTPALGRRSRQLKGPAARARLRREKQPEGLPPVVLPNWFWNRNVKLSGSTAEPGRLAVFAEGAVDVEDETEMIEVARRGDLLIKLDLPTTKDSRYTIDVDVYQEILATVKAGLFLRPPKTGKNVLRPHTVLQCPKYNGTYFLDAIVETISSRLGADLISLDAQDIAQIVGPYIDENLAWTSEATTSTLGYDAQKIAGKLEEYDNEEPSNNKGEGEEEEESTSIGNLSSAAQSARMFRDITSKLRGGQFKTSILEDATGFEAGPAHSGIIAMLGKGRGPNSQSSQPQPRNTGEQWSDLKITSALEAMIDAADTKRASVIAESPQEDESSAPKDLIIQLKDYKEIKGTDDGPSLLRSLQSVINKRWQDGRNILLIGTTANEDCGLAKSGIQYLQSDIENGEKRTIFVPPDRRETQDTALEADEKLRIRQMNIRHLEDMIMKLAEGNDSISLVVDLEKDLKAAVAFSAGLEEAVWTFPKVHRIATTVLGLPTLSNVVDGPVFVDALRLLSASDKAKFKWGAEELKQEDVDVDEMLQVELEKSKDMTKAKVKELRSKCNKYESKLLGGLVIPSDIRTTFDDVHAPKETIEALKTLISLSLVRPEAFSYGVLATDKIPGLLLYGPPGTGKTLLAKAVARDSGATVLNVSGAEINDMFVGEAEKNVKAIFSLAKKLSPCVVFIDEADAILAARGSNPMRGSHRDTINQFLREWDGMTDLSAFIMVATNRPYDLDEAVLRRLPRRILVDLPVEKDREAILKIHLKGEQLDPSVSLSTIAKNTPFYSGSDLKNLSVAAAMACIREENDVAAKHTGEEPYVYPEKRILTKAHFDKAMDEISASISEDMSTLAAIRKFDEKYGDRKGRRKKSAGIGFGGTSVPQLDSEAGRVRKISV